MMAVKAHRMHGHRCRKFAGKLVHFGIKGASPAAFNFPAINQTIRSPQRFIAINNMRGVTAGEPIFQVKLNDDCFRYQDTGDDAYLIRN